MTPEPKKSSDKKASARRSRSGLKVVLLKDLTPRSDVRGGARKVLFGQGAGKKLGE